MYHTSAPVQSSNLCITEISNRHSYLGITYKSLHKTNIIRFNSVIGCHGMAHPDREKNSREKSRSYVRSSLRRPGSFLTSLACPGKLLSLVPHFFDNCMFFALVLHLQKFSLCHLCNPLQFLFPTNFWSSTTYLQYQQVIKHVLHDSMPSNHSKRGGSFCTTYQ